MKYSRQDNEIFLPTSVNTLPTDILAPCPYWPLEGMVLTVKDWRGIFSLDGVLVQSWTMKRNMNSNVCTFSMIQSQKS